MVSFGDLRLFGRSISVKVADQGVENDWNMYTGSDVYALPITSFVRDSTEWLTRFLQGRGL